jgi:hypothetical protein
MKIFRTIFRTIFKTIFKTIQLLERHDASIVPTVPPHIHPDHPNDDGELEEGTDD